MPASIVACHFFAMKYARLAESSYRYNRAFEGWRTEFISANIDQFTFAAVVLAAAGVGLHFWLKKRKRSKGKEGETS